MLATATPHSLASGAAGRGPFAGFGDLLASEFFKLRSVRSTLWTLLGAVAANVVLAALAALFLVSRLSSQELASADHIRLSLVGLHLSQIAIGVLGVLAITSEYSTGMIRATLAAVPRRRMMLAAKTLAFAATALVVGSVACFAAYFAFQAFLPSGLLKSSLGDPGVARAVAGGGVYLAVLGLLGLGLGAILRSSAGAIAALFGLLFVPVILLSMLPHSWQTSVGPYLPMNAGDAMYSLHRETSGLSPAGGLGVLSLYAAIALTIGFTLMKHRDA
ncbi:ABC-2 type transport system permease protein [Streptacidiphilus sp. MAP12-16]|uniref:ABC transporter permease subunit n=1 Tax=Streptacidiphilus sp. MAP12-16 TaxID=3156300 RepID=UPI0035193839